MCRVQIGHVMARRRTGVDRSTDGYRWLDGRKQCANWWLGKSGENWGDRDTVDR